MNIFAKSSIMAIALALVLVPVMAIAATVNVSITAPADNVEVAVNQSIVFNGEATGGEAGTYAFNWTWGDGTQTSSANNNGQTAVNKAYDTIGAKTVLLRTTDINGDTGTDTITVNVVNATTTALAISNVRVTDITQSSAIVRWTTNKEATSRVIYDTTSHTDISGASAPNYSYANSTATSDESPKVTEHAVTVNGLSANTQYFFRVISTR